MLILFVLYFLSIFDFTIPTSYICDRRSSCGCSKRSTVFLTKIVGGEPVNLPQTWGWIGSLRRDNVHSCGASLLTPWFAITAAHCVYDIESLSRLSLNFGITNLSNIGELRDIIKIHIHPLYNQKLWLNDLAILHLNKPIDIINSDVSCICLPKISEFDLQSINYPPTGQNLIAIGWGVTNYFDLLASPILQQVTLKSMNNTDISCTNIINDDIVQFCAGYPEGGKDTCRGDSGGPLMIFRNGRWQLAGITSFGKICGSPGFAGVYTRVAYYESFIRNIIDNSTNIIKINVEKLDDKINHLRSNTEILYKKFNVELIFIFLYIIYRKI